MFIIILIIFNFLSHCSKYLTSPKTHYLKVLEGVWGNGTPGTGVHFIEVPPTHPRPLRLIMPRAFTADYYVGNESCGGEDYCYYGDYNAYREASCVRGVRRSCICYK